jgi:8-oxo-dGTP diphosphatase
MSREYPGRPIVGVGVVVWHDDRVLLVRRGKPPRAGHWSLPGGAQQLGETVAEAARREVKEEVGLEVTLGDIVATIDLIERDEDDRIRYHYTLIDFVAEAPGAALRPGSDAADARWFGVAEIEALGLWSETVRVIKLAAERRPCR